jgi:hypothetical protein
MSKLVTISLGEAIGLTARRLVIHRMMRATDKLTRPAAQYVGTLAGTATDVTVTLPDNVLWQAQLRDYKTTGEVSRVDVLNFHTVSLQFPGPKSEDRLSIYAMEDESSSSSLSSSSLSSSSVTSSSSSSSVTSSQSNSSSSSVTSSQSSSGMSSSSSSSGTSSASSQSSSSSSSSSGTSSESTSSSVSSSSGLPD